MKGKLLFGKIGSIQSLTRPRGNIIDQKFAYEGIASISRITKHK